MNIDSIKSVVDREGVIFLTYTGFLSQSLISAITAALEKEAENGRLGQGEAINIYTVFIEMAQNIMNYSRTPLQNSIEMKPEGLILVGFSASFQHYYIQSQNIVLASDKHKIQKKLDEIQQLDKEMLKKRYRELRRTGRDSHDKGGGIGLYEIAKRSQSLEYRFENINHDKYSFYLTAIIEKKNVLENNA